MSPNVYNPSNFSPQPPSSVHQALWYLLPAATSGTWGHRVRDGFDSFVEGDPTRALLYYIEASELGVWNSTILRGYIFDAHSPSATTHQPPPASHQP